MHVQTHLMSGWCIGNLLPLGPRERLFCMAAATLPDLDGLGMLVSDDWYQRFHHILGHNLTVGLAIAVLLMVYSRRKPLLAGAAYLGLFHLHLLMDYYGSGPGWAISYWWPWGTGPAHWWMCDRAWEFYSWQNLSAAALFLAWTLAIVWLSLRTPLEALMPRLDEKLVAVIAGPRRGKRESVNSLTPGRDSLSD